MGFFVRIPLLGLSLYHFFACFSIFVRTTIKQIGCHGLVTENKMLVLGSDMSMMSKRYAFYAKKLFFYVQQISSQCLRILLLRRSKGIHEICLFPFQSEMYNFSSDEI